MHLVRCVVAALAMLPAAGPTAGQQGAANVARSLAATCAACHGTNGVSVGEVSSLAGRSKDDVVRRMQDFKGGRLPGTVMPQLAKGYTDEQIDLVAGWFAAQPAQ